MQGDGRRGLVIGVGNPDRGDDAAGLVVVRRLSSDPAVFADIVETSGEPAALIASLDAAAWAILVDAASGIAPGTVERFDVTATALPNEAFVCSTHAMGVAQALELARALGRLPPKCIVYGIGGESFETGAALTDRVAGAVDAAESSVREEIRALLSEGAVADA